MNQIDKLLARMFIKREETNYQYQEWESGHHYRSYRYEEENEEIL